MNPTRPCTPEASPAGGCALRKRLLQRTKRHHAADSSSLCRLGLQVIRTLGSSKSRRHQKRERDSSFRINLNTLSALSWQMATQSR